MGEGALSYTESPYSVWGRYPKRAGFSREFLTACCSTQSFQVRAEWWPLVDLVLIGPYLVVGRVTLTLWHYFLPFRMLFPGMALSSKAIPSTTPWSSCSGCWIACTRTWRAPAEGQCPRRSVPLQAARCIWFSCFHLNVYSTPQNWILKFRFSDSRVSWLLHAQRCSVLLFLSSVVHTAWRISLPLYAQ